MPSEHVRLAEPPHAPGPLDKVIPAHLVPPREGPPAQPAGDPKLAALLDELAGLQRAAAEARRQPRDLAVVLGSFGGLLLLGFLACVVLTTIDFLGGLGEPPGEVAVPGLLIAICATGGFVILCVLGWLFLSGELYRRVAAAEQRLADAARALLTAYPGLGSLGGEALLLRAEAAGALAEVARAAPPCEAVTPVAPTASPGRRELLLAGLEGQARRLDALETHRRRRFWVRVALAVVAAVFGLAVVTDLILLVLDVRQGRDTNALVPASVHVVMLVVTLAVWLCYRRWSGEAEQALSDQTRRLLADYPEIAAAGGGISALSDVGPIVTLARRLSGDPTALALARRRPAVWQKVLIGLGVYVGSGLLLSPLMLPLGLYFEARDREQRYALRLTPERPLVVLAPGKSTVCRVHVESASWSQPRLSASVVAQDDEDGRLAVALEEPPADPPGGRASYRDVQVRSVAGTGEFTVRVGGMSDAGRPVETYFTVKVRP
jgi:hypothetical protein